MTEHPTETTLLRMPVMEAFVRDEKAKSEHVVKYVKIKGVSRAKANERAEVSVKKLNRLACAHRMYCYMQDAGTTDILRSMGYDPEVMT